MEFQDFNEIFDHFKKTFCWECDIDERTVFDIAKNNFEKLSAGKTKNKFLLRLAGQSGSGKTTQLLPASNALFEKHQMNPIHFAVREFATLHPNYSEIVEKFGKKEMREKTNGFALKCLLVSLAFAIEQGYDILFEVTLLSHEFEDFVLNLISKNNYNALFFMLAVNKEISNLFIERRKAASSGAEANRVVYKSSSNYFDIAISDDVEYFSKVHGDFHVVIWNAYNFLPVFDGKFKDCQIKFFEAKKITSHEFADEQQLRDAKIDYVLKHF